jgi:hypothetical protein
MRRREFITLLGGGAAAWPLGAAGQQTGKLPTIGFLGTNTASAQRQWTDAFLQRLRELGWIEGRTVAIEYRWADGRLERSAEIVAELVRLKVDVIVTHSAEPVLAAKRATAVIPIIFPVLGDPFADGLDHTLVCRYRRPDVVRGRRTRRVPTRRSICAEDFAGPTAERLTHRATHEIRACRQPEDCEGHGPHDPRIILAARGRANRMNSSPAFDRSWGDETQVIASTGVFRCTFFVNLASLSRCSAARRSHGRLRHVRSRPCGPREAPTARNEAYVIEDHSWETVAKKKPNCA